MKVSILETAEQLKKQSLQPISRVKSTSGEEKSIGRTRSKLITRVYDEQSKTNTKHVEERFGLIS